MLGAIIGDIVGSPYEWNNIHTKKFPFFKANKTFTDDTVMTCAIAEALMEAPEYTESFVKESVTKQMRNFGKKYYDAGYGGNFNLWLFSRNPQPYGSFGNGSAMRVSPAGWLFNSLEETKQVARWTAQVTHNHTEGVKGAEATAVAIFLARTGKSKEAIKFYIKSHYYSLEESCDEIRANYSFNETCQGTVPQAIQAFLEGNSFEDVVRTAVSLGGDSDTLACIAGRIAEAFYGIPKRLQKQAFVYLPPDLEDVVNRFYAFKKDRCKEIGKNLDREAIEKE